MSTFPPFYKVSSLTESEVHPIPVWPHLNYISKDPLSKQGNTWRHWEIGLMYEFWGDTIQLTPWTELLMGREKWVCTLLGQEYAFLSGIPGDAYALWELLYYWMLLWFAGRMSICGFPDSSVGKESACNAGDPGSITGLRKSSGEGIGYPLQYSWASLTAQLVKSLPAMQETWVSSLSWEDPLEKGKVTLSSILVWSILWTV